MSVGDWIEAKAPAERAPIVRKLILVAQKAAPKGTLSIKWGQPVFEGNGPVAFIKLAKAHITFGGAVNYATHLAGSRVAL